MTLKAITAPSFNDVQGTNITAEDWSGMTDAERAVAAVVGSTRRRVFVPEDDAQLIRNLTVAAQGEIVPRARPHTELFTALWSTLAADALGGDGALWAVIWDPDCVALSFVPVGAPLTRCTNVYFKGDGRIVVEGNGQPAAAENAAVLWVADDEVAAAMAEQWGVPGGHTQSDD